MVKGLLFQEDRLHVVDLVARDLVIMVVMVLVVMIMVFVFLR